LVGVFGKVEFRLAQLRPVRWRLQIEIDRRPLAGDFKRQGRLANLPEAQQTNGRVPVEHCRHGGLFFPSLQFSRSMAYLRGLTV